MSIARLIKDEGLKVLLMRLSYPQPYPRPAWRRAGMAVGNSFIWSVCLGSIPRFSNTGSGKYIGGLIRSI